MNKNKFGSLEDYNKGNVLGKKFLFMLAHANVNPTVTKSNKQIVKYPPRRSTPLIDEIFDADEGINRAIRYTQGAISIYYNPNTTDTNEREKKAYRAEFKDGRYIVNGTNRVLLDFMMKTNYNVSVVGRDTEKVGIFKFVDIGKRVVKEIEDKKQKQAATAWCYDADWSDVKAFALVKLRDGGRGLDVQETRFSLSLAAENDPINFMIEKNNPANKRKSLVIEAIQRGILHEDTTNNTISWSSNKLEPLVNSVMGVSPVDRFVEASFTEGGQKIFTHLQSLVQPQELKAAVMNTVLPKAEEVVPQVKEPEEKPIVYTSDENFKEIVEIYEEVMKKNLITFNRGWHTVKGQKIQANRDKFLIMMKEDKNLLDKIKSELENSN